MLPPIGWNGPGWISGRTILKSLSSFGDLNFILFNPDESVTVEKIIMAPGKKKELEALVNDYKVEWIKLLDELQTNGEDYMDTAKWKLEDLYNQKKTWIRWF